MGNGNTVMMREIDVLIRVNGRHRGEASEPRTNS